MEPHLLALPAFLGWLVTLGKHSFLTPGRPSREAKARQKLLLSAGSPGGRGLTLGAGPTLLT